LRGDGVPTYNFGVVIDDLDMNITHVIRGDDHVNNTPRQINILRALGAPLPQYAHVPMILGADGERLSKRHGAVSVMQYREDGYLPEALVNYLARLGWSHGDEEIFSREQLVEWFDLSAINRSPAKFNPEKLQWLNQQHIMRTTPELLARYLRPQLAALGIVVDDYTKLAAVARVQQERAKTLKEMAHNSTYFFIDLQGYDEKAAKKNLTAEAVRPLTVVLEKLTALTDWRAAAIHDVVNLVAAQLQLGLGKVAQPIRVAVSGTSVSPPIDVTLEALGRQATLARLQRALEYASRQ